MQPPPLTTRERADRRPLGVGVEPELLHEPDLLPVRLGDVAGDGFPHPLGRLELAPDLVVVPEPHRGTGLDAAGGG